MSELKEDTKVEQVAKEVSADASKVDVTSDCYESSDEEIVLDEPSDTEDFVPPQQDDGNETDDDSCSSGEEEDGVHVHSNEIGGMHFSKLVFDDIEEKKKECSESEEEEEENEDKENQEQEIDDKDDHPDKDAKKEMLGSPFKTYRTQTALLLDEAMDENYKSDEDEAFDPIYCGETLSDIEYLEGDTRDTESEPETEEIGGKHKKTGEALISIKMIEELKIPDETCSKEECLPVKVDSAMECS